ncbi:MAG: carbohydrate kinase family protein [Ignavibacteria bacterium]|nr:carbohydrate kinase family protein [Ignavibacteria bacterium]
MRLLVAGHSVLDHISEPAGFRFQPGGVFYSAMALATLQQPGDGYFLCTLLEKGKEDLFEQAFRVFDTGYSTYSERIPRVHLTIHNVAERCERFENLNQKVIIPFGDLHRFDGLLINMISGFEMEVADLERIRSEYNGPIYFDVHSLSRGVGESLVREFRTIPDFAKWACHLTIVQANESEILTLLSDADEYTTCHWLLTLGVKIVLVTRGENGSTMYVMGSGGMEVTHQSVIPVLVCNKVGCGDTFGAYFFYHYIKNNNAPDAFRLAGIAGSVVTQFNSIKDLMKTADDVRQF